MNNAKRVIQTAEPAEVAALSIPHDGYGLLVWRQTRWAGAGEVKAAVEWEGEILGHRVAAIVKGRRSYRAYARKIGLVGCYPTLATAQEEAMFAVTEVPVALCDFFAWLRGLVEERAAWVERDTPHVTEVLIGFTALILWANEAWEEAEAARRTEAARLLSESKGLLATLAAKLGGKFRRMPVKKASAPETP